MDSETYEYIERLILRYLLVIAILIAIFIIFILPVFENKTKQENASYNQTNIERELEEENFSR